MTEKNGSYDYLADLSLSEISEQYGTKGLTDKYQYEIAKLPDEVQQRVNQAYLAAEQWHQGQERTNGPYIDHILRVMLRILGNYQIDDPDILVAALLHDSLED